MESCEYVFTPVPANAHAQVKAFAALNKIRIPEAYEKLIWLALTASSGQK